MSKVYTSRYSNKGLSETEALKVCISRGKPRFPIKYELAGTIFPFAPPRDIFGLDKHIFERRYRHHLDRIGKDRALEMIQEYTKDGKDIILLCFEDITKEPVDENWCHRTMLAEWLKENLGIEVEEFPDEGCYAEKHKCDEEPFDQMSLF